MELSGEPTILMSQYGAYGPAQIYSRDDIVDIVKYANLKGDPDSKRALCMHVGYLVLGIVQGDSSALRPGLG